MMIRDFDSLNSLFYSRFIQNLILYLALYEVRTVILTTYSIVYNAKNNTSTHESEKEVDLDCSNGKNT